MASVASVIADIRAAIEALPPSGVGSARPLDTDYATDLDSLVAGEIAYHLRHQQQLARVSSNIEYETLAIEVVPVYHLADGEAERTYTEGLMLSWMSQLLSRGWWEGTSAGIHQIVATARPDIQEDVGRVGNIVVYSVLLVVEIVPG